MKIRFKLISFSLLIILILALSIGCTPTDDIPNDESKANNLDEEIFMELGFLDERYMKDDKKFIVIETNEKDLELEILDDDLFDSLKADEYYMVSYNKNNIVLSIDTNDFIKDLVVESSEQDNDTEELAIINKGEKFDTSHLTLLDAFIIDIDNNGEDEKVAMYTRAEKDKSGEIMWDDGQDWIILVEGKDNDYVLFDNYVQLGTIQLFAYTVDDDFYIVTIQSGTANLTVKEYKFNKEIQAFEAKTGFTTSGNVNMLHMGK